MLGGGTMNSFAPIDPTLVDVFLPDGTHDGYPEHLAKLDTLDVLRDCCGDATRDFPKSLWIEPKDWEAKARENDAAHTWPINYVDRFTCQNPTDECTTHSLRTSFECARNRQIGLIYPEGPKKDFRYEESGKFGSVWVSCISIYAEANPHQSGGANVQQVLEIAVKRGFLPDKIQPHDYGFKHTLVGTCGEGNTNQSHGPWVPLGKFPEGWQQTAATLKPLEVIFPEEWEQAICLVMNGIAVSVGRKGHAIPYSLYNVKEQKMGYVDSYNVVRWDSLSTVKSCAADGSFAIATVTAPDDWSDPAGVKK
jgi:hypothetical protein